MARNNDILGVFEDSKKTLDISFHKSHLTGGEYGKIERRTIDIRNIIAGINKKSGVTFNKNTLYYAAQLFKEEILEHLERGFAINLFELGVLYITVKGEVNESMTNAELAEHIELAFNPSKEAEERVKNFAVQKINVKPSSRYITKIVNLADESAEWLSSGMYVKIVGSGLKLGGESCGVYLADEKAGDDRSKWLEVKKVCRNEPKCLEFFLPKCSGKYRIIIETMLSVSFKPMKSIAQITSDLLEIREE